MAPPRLLPPTAPGGPPADVEALLQALGADPRPRLTWYGPGDQRVELTGRVLLTWVAKTAHLLLEEADLAPGGTVAVDLPGDWRTPVLWLAAGHLGALPTGPVGPDGDPGSAPDVEVVAEDRVPADAATRRAVVVVVPHAAVPAPLAGLPAGCVDYGGEVSGFPDTLPPAGPSTRLPAPAGTARRVLAGPDATPAGLLAAWAAGGSVVLHTGLAPEQLERVRTQENVEG